MTPEKIIAAQVEVARLTHELDITNADHIALWLEANMANSQLAWMACRIIEAHEAELAERDARIRVLEEASNKAGHLIDTFRFESDADVFRLIDAARAALGSAKV